MKLVCFECKGALHINVPLDQLDSFDLSDSEKIEIREVALWTETKRERDALLSKTDWTQIPDAQLTTDKKAEFAAYRQSLRDIPQTYPNPDDVIWPEKPTI